MWWRLLGGCSADGICDDVDDCVGAYDACGICNGPGAVYECGCADIPSGDCDCNGNENDALGQCGGDCEADVDADGICDDVDDCVGEFDTCGVCNGPGAVFTCGCAGIPQGDCDCEGNQLDALGVCGGDCAADADGDGTYWRITQYFVPSHGTGPSTLPGETYFGYTLVPIDDTSHWMYTYGWNPERELTREERAKLDKGHGIVAEVDEHFEGIRNSDNDYLIDRHAQATESYTGVRGLAEQDAMIQESQGPIADRTRENLSPTDAAVVRFRRTVLSGARQVAAGDEVAAPHHHDLFHARPGSWMTGDGIPFEDVMRERFGHPLGRMSNNSE